MSKNKKLVFIDIDGCLTTGKNNSIPWQYVKVLQTAFRRYQNDYEYIITTARPAPYAEAVIQFLGIMNVKLHRYAICESGTVLHLFGSDKFFVSPGINHDSLINFEKDLRWLQEVYHFNIEDGRKRTICVLASANQDLTELSEILKKHLPTSIGMYISAGGIDFVPNKINKATTVLSLAEKLNVNLAEAICIGDSEGDIPLIEIVGNPSCPKNANDKVKKLVKSKNGYIAKQDFSLGVAEILHHFNKNNSIKKVSK